MKKLKNKLAILCVLTMIIASISVTSSFAETNGTTLNLDSSNNLDKIALESNSYQDN